MPWEPGNRGAITTTGMTTKTTKGEGRDGAKTGKAARVAKEEREAEGVKEEKATSD